MSAPPVQVFVRNDKGKVWGPLEPTTIELLIDNGLIEGRLQVSRDGVHYAFPGRFAELRDYFPRSLWGEIPADAAAAPARPAAVAATLGGAAPTPNAAAPRSAAPPVAGPGAVFAAGPGARAAAQARGTPVRGTTPPVAPAGTPPSPSVAPIAPPPPAAASPAEPAGEGLPASGELAKLPPIRIYYLAAAGDQTVQVVFHLADRDITVHFRKGSPDFIDSTHVEDSLAAFLLKQGLVTPDQLAQAEQGLERFGGELIGALFGLGLINPGTAFPQLAQRAQTLLLRALFAESGTFEAHPRELPPHKVMPLGNRWAALTEAVRRVPTKEFRRRLQPAMDLPIMKSGGRVPTSELRLTPQETRALGYIDGVRSLSQLATDLPQEIDHLLRLAYVLKDLEIVSFAATPVRRAEPPKPAPSAPPPAATPPPAKSTPTPVPGGAPKPAAAPRPAAPAPAKAAATPAPVARPTPVPTAAKPVEPPAAPLSPEAELKELQARVAKLKDQNLFEVLGLQQNTDSNAVKLAYFKLARVYHPDTVPPDAPPEIGKLKGEIFARVGDAYRRLGEDKSRAEYIEELKHGGGEQVDVQQILMAEEFFQKGCILVKARKFAEAVKMLDDAIKANDKEGEFYAWRAYAKYFAASDKAAARNDVAKDFSTAQKMNDRAPALHYFMGHIAKLSGDNSGALKHFKKTVELAPEHTDALRELRMMSSAKK